MGFPNFTGANAFQNPLISRQNIAPTKLQCCRFNFRDRFSQVEYKRVSGIVALFRRW